VVCEWLAIIVPPSRPRNSGAGFAGLPARGADRRAYCIRFGQASIVTTAQNPCSERAIMVASILLGTGSS
jgi:hypothetical protein